MTLLHRTLSVSLFMAALSTPALAEVVTIRADAWCPYNCDVTGNLGYGIEVLQEAIKAGGHSVDYKIEPWQRALTSAKEGKIISVIGANNDDIKQNGLKKGKEPIGASSNCAFVRQGSTAKYAKASDLAQFKKIGIINEYTYAADIDAWIKDPANKGKLDVVAGDEPVVINAKKLDASRVDAVIEDKAVMGFTLKKLALDKKITSAGCTKAEPIFIAFSPKAAKTPELIKQLDDGIAAMRKSGKLKEILAKYGVSDWK